MRIEKIVVRIEYDTDSDPMERRKGVIEIKDPGVASDVVMCIRAHMGMALKKLSSQRIFARDKPYPGSLRDMLTRHGWKIKTRKAGDLLSGLLYGCPDCKKWLLFTELEDHLVKCGRGNKCSLPGCCVPYEDKAKKKRIAGKTKTFRKVYGGKRKKETSLQRHIRIGKQSERDIRNEEL